jgi:hypothetical protein
MYCKKITTLQTDILIIEICFSCQMFNASLAVRREANWPYFAATAFDLVLEAALFCKLYEVSLKAAY